MQLVKAGLYRLVFLHFCLMVDIDLVWFTMYVPVYCSLVEAI